AGNAHDVRSLALQHGAMIQVQLVDSPAAAEVIQTALVGVCAGNQLGARVGLQYLGVTDGQNRTPCVAGELVHVETAHGAAADKRRTIDLTCSDGHWPLAPGMLARTREGRSAAVPSMLRA